ncbi:MAG: hypothetical protein IJ723_00265 [Ruminococcus sp.]|nr:hypothetical protein [Ruminococcus sp.]
MTGNNERNERAYELYRAVSDVDERYVGEMLDDDLAEKIRAANKRRRITVRSSVTAAAAVFVLVIGIGVLPNLGGMKKYDSAGDRNENAAVAQQEKSETEEAAADDTDLYDGETAEAEDIEEEPAYDDAMEAAPTDNAEIAADENEAYENNKGNAISPDRAYEGEQQYDAYDLVTLEDGRSYLIFDDGDITEDMLGDTLAETEEYVFYELKNIDPEAGAAAYIRSTDKYMLAVPAYSSQMSIDELLQALKGE